jgi:hypothetical protein
MANYTYSTNKQNNNNKDKMLITKHFIIIIIIIVNKRLHKHLERIPGQHSIDSLQKTAILGTSHIIRKVLQAET